MPLEAHRYDFLNLSSDPWRNPLVNKTNTNSVFKKLSPNEYDMQVTTNGTVERLPKTSFAPGFELSPETAALLAEKSSYQRGLDALAAAKGMGILPYKRCLRHVLVNVSSSEDGEEEAAMDDPQVETRSYQSICFHTMKVEIETLARIPGSVARDIIDANLYIYRQDWGTAVNTKYLKLTDAQQDRKATPGSFVPWESMTNIKEDRANGQWAIKAQLEVPELRDKRMKYVQREAAVSNLRYIFYCLSHCAAETREANKGFDWDPDNPANSFNVPDSAKEHWEDAVNTFVLYQRMATRFCDANESPLSIHAVIWELYHNKNHPEPKVYLRMLDRDTDEDPKLNEFLKEFNTCEMAHIKCNAANAWQKARVFFLFKGAIKGLSGDDEGGSIHATRQLIEWWRSFTAFQKYKREEEAGMDAMCVPEDQRDIQAEIITGEDDKTWEDLTEEQKAEVNRLWRVGVIECRKQTIRDNEARFRAEEQARQRESEAHTLKTTKERSLLAFPKPSAMEEFADSEFREHNPDFKKRQEAKEEAKKRRAALGKDKVARKQTKLTQSVAASASASALRMNSESSSDEDSDDSDENDEERRIIAKRRRMNAANRAKMHPDTSDDDSDSA